MKQKNKKPVSLSFLLDKPTSLYEKFHNLTMNRGKINKIEVENWPAEWKKIYYKAYARFPEIPLPKPSHPQNIPFIDALLQRKSQRQFSPQALSLKKLSTLLYYSVGLNKNQTDSTRFYPSAGARYPIETYLLSLNSELEKGVYHYYVKNHSLELLELQPSMDPTTLFTDQWVSQASCILIFTAVFKRNTIKYGDRGYRHILTEVGHIGQNALLLSSSLQLACCPTESFIDTRINTLLNIDGINEAVIYAVAIGEPLS